MVYPIKCCSFNSPGARHFKKHLTFKKSDWFQVPPPYLKSMGALA